MIKKYTERKLVVGDKEFYPLKDVLIFDIETDHQDKNTVISADNCKFKIWGAFSYNTGRLSFGHGPSFQKLIDDHKIIIGHNIKGFDIPVLERDLGINFKNKIIVDTLEVLRKPASKSEKESMKKKGKRPIYGKGRSLIIGEARQIGMIDNRFPDFKLSTIAKHGYKLFKDHPVYSKYFTEYKNEEFDYDILNKEELTDDEWNYVKEYLRQDIIVTKNLFEFLEKYFESFADGLSDEDINNLEYVHAPMGKYVYKCLCNELGLEEKYADVIPGKFPGAFVFLPIREKYTPEDGDGYCIDFASQHPSHQRMENLCTPAEKCKHKVNGKCPTAHSGDGKIFKLKGTYCACEQGPIEKKITKWYLDRVEFKKNKDPREYAVKIKINGTYGVLSSSMFESTYYKYTGEDTTRMSKQSTKFMAKHMEKGGYIVTYGDSVSGESYIYSKKHGRIKIKEYFNIYNKKHKNFLDGKEIAFTDDYSLSSSKNGKIQWDNCNYIMRHKVNKDMYRIYVTNTEYIDVTKDHSIMIEKNNKLIEIKPTKLKVGDKILFLNKKPIAYNKKYKNDIMMFLGYWIGDGSYSKNNYVNISSGDKDEILNLINNITDYWNCNFNISKNGFDYTINSTKLVKWMKNKGFIGKSSTKRIPDYIKKLNLQCKANFLNGYFSADGTVLSNGYIRLTSINIDLLKDVQELLFEFGITSKIITENKPNYYKTKDKYYCNGSISKHLIISKYDNKKFYDNIGFFIKRKQNKILFSKTKQPLFGNLLNVRIQKIIKLPKKDDYVYDLCMQKNSNFIANNILVHNTDSLYIMDPFRDKERMKAHMAKGIEQIKAVMPFADDYYNMDIDAEFSHIFFFQDKDSKDKHFKKKNYIYILQPDKDGNVKVKINGLPILKSNAPLLAKKIYMNYLEDEIKRTKNIKFQKDYIRQLIQFEIEKGIDVLLTKIKVNPANTYASETQLQAQISERYFDGMGGIFEGIKHKRKGYGVGKGKFYCSLEEAKVLGFHELDLDSVWKTLDPFIKEDKQTGLFDF